MICSTLEDGEEAGAGKGDVGLAGLETDGMLLHSKHKHLQKTSSGHHRAQTRRCHCGGGKAVTSCF